MHNINVFISSLFSNIISVIIVGVIITYFFGNIGKIITIILLIGAVLAAKDSIREKSIEDEMKAFDEALNDTINSMR